MTKHVTFLCSQNDHADGVCSVLPRHAGVHLHDGPGPSAGGLLHCRSTWVWWWMMLFLDEQ